MLNTPGKKISFLLACLLGCVVFMLIDCSNDIQNEAHLKSWKSVAITNATEVKLWKNQEGLSRARAGVAEADRDILEQAYGEQFRAMRKELDIKSKQLQSATFIKTQTSGSIKTITRDSLIYLDTTQVKAKVFQFRDRWATINGIFSRDSLSLNYSFVDSLTIATSWRRKHLFANRELQIDALSSNPYSSITGLSSLTVRDPKKSRVGIGPFVGIGLNGKPVIGIGVQYSLLKF